MSRVEYGPPRRKRALLLKHGIAYGEKVTFGCDGRCDKAWGINGRPAIRLSRRDDDTVWIPDDVLGVAPGPGQTVGLSEGGDIKPSAVQMNAATAMNKWCFRECERSARTDGHVNVLLVPDLNRPHPNIPRRS